MTSTSDAINRNCILRRNLHKQPYGRCSVCTLALNRCHAWQASLLSFGMIVLALGAVVVPGGWPLRAIALAMIGLVIAEGRANHRRTDELIASEAALRDNNARLERMVSEATRALTESNRELATSNLELIETDRLREAFLANVAHDLRTPLTAIRGAADNLLDGIAGPLSPDQSEYVAIVRDHATRLTGSLNELLQSARLQSGHVRLESEEIDLHDLVRDVVHGLAPLAHEKALDLRAETVPAAVRGDRAKLRLALENLVANAIKFTGEGGVVEVGVSSGERAVVSVRDSGVGIPAEELPHLFERFYRGSSRAPGTGLGLSIARNLVRLHGGDVLVESVAGRGSEFRVVLPPAQRGLPILRAG